MQQVIDVVKKVVAEGGCELVVENGERRAGDPAVLVADVTFAKKELGWQPQYGDLEIIVCHAWSWEKQQANL